MPASPAADPLTVTAEQMHISTHDHLGLRWVGYQLVDIYAGTLSPAAKIGYQLQLDVKKGFLQEESERLLYIAHEPLRRYIDKCNKIKHLTMTTQRNIAVIGSKGGVGKTPLSCGLVALLQAISQFACLIIDANHNHGTTGPRLGIPRSNHVLLLEALANFDLVKDYSTASMNLGRHQQTGVQALLSNPNTTKEQILMDLFIKLFELLDTCFHSIVADTGNGNEHAVNEGSFLMADAVAVSIMADKPESFETALTTLLAFFQLGHTDKVKNALKVINATRAGDTKEKFMHMFRAAAEAITIQRDPLAATPEGTFSNPDELLEALGVTMDNIYPVPFSEYIHRNGIVSLRPEDTGLATLDAYADILLQIFTMEVPDKKTKKEEINRRLLERGEVEEIDTISEPAKLEEEMRRLRAKLVGFHDGDIEKAILSLMKQFPETKGSLVRQ
jgi:MinD-like ATPase involved in chromosome partitioning or flagellar assembly